jgi:hypothetical protein
LGFFYISNRIHARPPAANANRWAVLALTTVAFQEKNETKNVFIPSILITAGRDAYISISDTPKYSKGSLDSPAW